MPISKTLTWIENNDENVLTSENLPGQLSSDDESNDPDIENILKEFESDYPDMEISQPISEEINLPEPKEVFKLSPLEKCLELTQNGLTLIAGSSETGKKNIGASSIETQRKEVQPHMGMLRH